MPDVLTATDARAWAVFTRAAFAARREEVDALNVFPVPDGDTGTNLYLTMDTAVDEVSASHEREGIGEDASLVQECRALGRAVLLAARGNSGVITSQIIGGLCEVVVEEGLQVVDGPALARALRRGARLARRSVAHPVEGTILTVVDAAADAARAAADDDGGLPAVVRASVLGARAALARTPEQLPVLAAAGVVDAGGAGCVLMLEALQRVVTGEWDLGTDASVRPGAPPRAEWHPRGVAPRGRPVPGGGDESTAGVALDGYGHPVGDGPAYEVVFLVEDASATRVHEMRRVLDGLGDSLVLVGGPDLWKVHVHVDDVGAAIEAGIATGRVRDIHVTHFASRSRHGAGGGGVGVVACAAGPGIARLMEAARATVVMSLPGARASAGQLLSAARGLETTCVVILPNDGDTLMAADAAARSAREDHGLEVEVVPARTAVQGLAALAVRDPDRSLHDNVVAMTAAAAGTRHGAVTVAYKEALTWAGHCRPGDVLGIVEGEIVLVCDSLAAAALEVLTRLLAAGGELVTLVTGAQDDPELLAAVERFLREEHGELEVTRIAGGQPTYPLLIGIE